MHFGRHWFQRSSNRRDTKALCYDKPQAQAAASADFGRARIGLEACVSLRAYAAPTSSTHALRMRRLQVCSFFVSQELVENNPNIAIEALLKLMVRTHGRCWRRVLGLAAGLHRRRAKSTSTFRCWSTWT